MSRASANLRTTLKRSNSYDRRGERAELKKYSKKQWLKTYKFVKIDKPTDSRS